MIRRETQKLEEIFKDQRLCNRKATSMGNKDQYQNQILNSIGWNRWLECVAPPTINQTAHKSSRFLPNLPKMGHIVVQKIHVKYVDLEVLSCQNQSV